jgi:hypothetical protein
LQTSWRIYKDPDNALTNSTSRRAFWSAFCTFNLAIMGGSVLPMPYAMSKTGVLVGMLTMLLVALCNDYTTCLTISAAYTTGLDSFEALAHWAGGPHWKVGQIREEPCECSRRSPAVICGRGGGTAYLRCGQ